MYGRFSSTRNIVYYYSHGEKNYCKKEYYEYIDDDLIAALQKELDDNQDIYRTIAIYKKYERYVYKYLRPDKSKYKVKCNKTCERCYKCVDAIVKPIYEIDSKMHSVSKDYNLEPEIKSDNGYDFEETEVYIKKRGGNEMYVVKHADGSETLEDSYQQFVGKNNTTVTRISDRVVVYDTRNTIKVTSSPFAQTKSKTNQEGNNMFGTGSTLKEIFGTSFDFGEVTGAKLTFDGKVAIDAGAGRFKVYNPTTKTVTDTTELSMDGKGLIMKLPVQKLEAGDVIVKNRRYYFVKEVNEDGEVKVVSLDDSKIETFAPETNLMNINFYTKVVSVLNGLGGTTGSNNMMQTIMMTKLLGNKGSIGSNDGLMTILALQSLNGNGAGFEGLFANPMTMLLLSGDKGGLTEMLPLMMLGGATGGANPFGNIFGTTAPVTPKKLTKAQLKKAVEDAEAALAAAKAAAGITEVPVE